MTDFWIMPSYEKTFKNAGVPGTPNKEITLEMAKNEYESAQILIRGETGFTVESVVLPDISPISLRVESQEYIKYDDGIDYPDALSPCCILKVRAGETAVFWITAYTPKGTEAGQYRGNICIITTQGEITVPLSVKVYNVTIPDASEGKFSLEYWMNAVGYWWRYPEAQKEDFILERYGFSKYTPQWWQVVGSIADNMRESRCNVLYVRAQDLLIDGGTVTDNDGNYIFNWNRFDEYIHFFINRAGIKTLIGFHLIRQTEGGYVHTPYPDENGVMSVMDKSIGSAEAEKWLNQFLPALKEHLIENGWYGMWRQHIQDEPAESAPWKYGRAFVRKHMPEVKCADALDNHSPAIELQGQMDFWIPRIDIYEKNREFYDFRLIAGDERWVYTCCMPDTPNYLNKFIDRPLWQNRLLSWGCFSRGFTGFLHWGYNYWSTEDTAFGMRPDAWTKGDGFIVYPDSEREGIKNSIRMMSTRDGVEDYELLYIAAQKNAVEVFSLARRLVASFDNVNWSVEEMMECRRRLLILAEERN